MPDLLLFFKDGSDSFALEDLATRRGFRVKSTCDLGVATEWLRIREFEVALVESSVPSSEQQSIGGSLWQRNPLAKFISYNLEGKEGLRKELGARLLGAELAIGPNALAIIERHLEEVKPLPALVGRPRVLVVEDLDSPRDIICSYLEGVGYPDAVGVSSAKQALEILLSDPSQFGCVVTDFKMPDMTGDELIIAIRKSPELRHLPVLVLTAYGTSDCLIDCLKAGATGFLVKPPKRNDFTRELSRAVRVLAARADPRLAKPEEVETVRELLAERGI